MTNRPDLRVCPRAAPTQLMRLAPFLVGVLVEFIIIIASFSAHLNAVDRKTLDVEFALGSGAFGLEGQNRVVS